MTAYNTSLYDAQVGATAAAPAKQSLVDAKEAGSVSRFKIAETNAATAWAQDDTINICKLPKGARVLSVRITNAALGSSVTLAVTGNDGSARTFVTAYSVTSAGNQAFKGSEYITALAADTTLVATLAGANPTDNAKITFVVEYVSAQA